MNMTEAMASALAEVDRIYGPDLWAHEMFGQCVIEFTNGTSIASRKGASQLDATVFDGRWVDGAETSISRYLLEKPQQSPYWDAEAWVRAEFSGSDM